MNPDSSTISIRQALPEDAPILTALAQASKRSWGYPERWLEQWESLLTITPEYLRQYPVYLAWQDGQIVGFYSLVHKPSDGIPTLELDHFWIAPEAQGQGLGRRLFQHAVRQAASLGAELLEIESDPNAEGFYLRMGASRVGERATWLDGQPRILPLLRLELHNLPEERS